MFSRLAFKWHRFLTTSPAKHWLSQYKDYERALNSKVQTLWYNSRLKIRSYTDDGGSTESTGTYSHTSSTDSHNSSDSDSSVPFMITSVMKVQLRELGYKPEDISEMTPIVAAQILKHKVRFGFSLPKETEKVEEPTKGKQEVFLEGEVVAKKEETLAAVEANERTKGTAVAPVANAEGNVNTTEEASNGNQNVQQNDKQKS